MNKNDNNNNINEYGNLVVCIVKKSAGICKKIYQEKIYTSQHTALNSYKDIANQNASKVILALLKKRHPHHMVIDDIFLKLRPHNFSFIKPIWIIDYLDGGKNFDDGIPFFCSSATLYLENVCQVAAIYDPLHDELFYYQKDQGSFLNGKLIKDVVVNKASLRKRRKEIISVAWAAYSHARDYQLNEKIYSSVTKLFNQQRRLGSVALDLCYTALGRFGGIYCYNANLIDIAAGLPIAIGAGCEARNFLGDPFTLEDQNLIVANKSIINHLSTPIKTVYTSLFEEITSVTHPFDVNIFPPLLTGGIKLAISGAPGIQCNGTLFNQKRNLVADLKIIKQKGIKIIVSLLEEHEYKNYNISNFFFEASNIGLKAIHFPIVDRSFPKNKESVFELCQKINKFLQKKDGVIIHCLGGFGRSAMIAACLLLYRQPFISVSYLINIIRTIKNGTLTDFKQVKFIYDFDNWLQKYNT